MSDLISRTELFNRLARIPIYAVEERTEIYKVINEMETVMNRDICSGCDGFIYDYCEECKIKEGNKMKELISQLEVLAKEERKRADQTHGDRFSSNHEAYAVVLEEMDEAEFEDKVFRRNLNIVWDKVKCDLDPKNNWKDLHDTAMRCSAEWLQVATMCEKAMEVEQ